MSNSFHTDVFPANSSSSEMKCMFCGKTLSRSDANSADDYGLHVETRDKWCCDECNQLVTIPNRVIKSIIDAHGPNKKEYLEMLASIAVSNYKQF